MLYDIVTYANRAQGMYAALVNNKHDVKVITLGWGTEVERLHRQVQGHEEVSGD